LRSFVPDKSGLRMTTLWKEFAFRKRECVL
jgi:hypothetical protein